MKSNTQLYRHEFKYLISEPLMVLLRERLRYLLPLDSHAGKEGLYSIRSLYFDDYYNTCYHENEDGTDPREKYRIRIYNASDSRITLERKQKESGMTRKTSCPLTREQAQQLMESLPLSFDDISNPTLRKFVILMMQRQMYPSIIVEYQRAAYIFPTGNVRVTFDTNLVSSCDFANFFNPSVFCRSVLPVGYHLMEVKFDQFCPDFIFQSLQLNQLQQTTFSKYFLCRKYNTF